MKRQAVLTAAALILAGAAQAAEPVYPPACRLPGCADLLRSPERADGPAAAGENSDAARLLTELGVKFARGMNGVRSPGKAIDEFTIAAGLGSVEAAFNLGVIYAAEETRNDASAAGWFRTAADGGDTEAAYLLGTMHETGAGVARSPEEALRLYRIAAGRWHTPALDGIGRLYEERRALPDPAVAARWQALAKEHTQAKAAYLLGVECCRGTGMARNYVEGLVWLRLSARAGYVPACYVLALLYQNGEQVPRDLTEAVAWYREAATHGDADSQFQLGVLEAKENPVEAYVWLDLAHRQGVQGAAEHQQHLTERMSRKDFYAAQRLRREWMQLKGLLPR